MSDITDMILEGILCEGCGEYLDDDKDYPHLETAAVLAEMVRQRDKEAREFLKVLDNVLDPNGTQSEEDKKTFFGDGFYMPKLWAEQVGRPLSEPTAFNQNPEPEKAPSAFDTQVGGDHYRKMKIQPLEFTLENNLNFCQGNIIKYVTRYKDKNGIEDLKKAKHYIDLLIDFESRGTK